LNQEEERNAGRDVMLALNNMESKICNWRKSSAAANPPGSRFKGVFNALKKALVSRCGTTAALDPQMRLLFEYFASLCAAPLTLEADTGEHELQQLRAAADERTLILQQTVDESQARLQAERARAARDRSAASKDANALTAQLHDARQEIAAQLRGPNEALDTTSHRERGRGSTSVVAAEAKLNACRAERNRLRVELRDASPQLDRLTSSLERNKRKVQDLTVQLADRARELANCERALGAEAAKDRASKYTAARLDKATADLTSAASTEAGLRAALQVATKRWKEQSVAAGCDKVSAKHALDRADARAQAAEERASSLEQSLAEATGALEQHKANRDARLKERNQQSKELLTLQDTLRCREMRIRGLLNEILDLRDMQEDNHKERNLLQEEAQACNRSKAEGWSQAAVYKALLETEKEKNTDEKTEQESADSPQRAAAALAHVRALCSQSNMITTPPRLLLQQAARQSPHQSEYSTHYANASSVEDLLQECLGISEATQVLDMLRNGTIASYSYVEACAPKGLIPEMFIMTGTKNKLTADGEAFITVNAEGLPLALRRAVAATVESMKEGVSPAKSTQLVGLAFDIEFSLNNLQTPACDRDGRYDGCHTIFVGRNAKFKKVEFRTTYRVIELPFFFPRDADPNWRTPKRTVHRHFSECLPFTTPVGASIVQAFAKLGVAAPPGVVRPEHPLLKSGLDDAFKQATSTKTRKHSEDSWLLFAKSCSTASYCSALWHDYAFVDDRPPLLVREKMALTVMHRELTPAEAACVTFNWPFDAQGTGWQVDWIFAQPIRVPGEPEGPHRYEYAGVETRPCPDGRSPDAMGLYATHDIPECTLFPILGPVGNSGEHRSFRHSDRVKSLGVVSGAASAFPPESKLHRSIASALMANQPRAGTTERVNCFFWNGFLLTTRNIRANEQLLVCRQQDQAKLGFGKDPPSLATHWEREGLGKPPGQPTEWACADFLDFYARQEIHAANNEAIAHPQEHWGRPEEELGRAEEGDPDELD
jgi:hypothetical protein